MATLTTSKETGLYLKFYTEAEQQKTWEEILTDVSPVGKDIALYTPRDNKEYFILSETETSYNKFTAKIKANGKTFNVKYDLCNQHEKTYSAVRKAYNI